MRYVCLFHVDKAKLDALSPAELEAFDLANRDADAALIASGHYVTALALADIAATTTVRRAAGAVAITDGPYAESREVLARLLIVDVASREEALAIALKGPMADFGTVEIRPELEVGWQKAQQGR